MIEEDAPEPPPSRLPALLGGIVLGAFGMLITALILADRDYVPKQEAAAYLAERGYAVLTIEELSALRARPEACLTTEVCANQIDINRRFKIRFQALEANNLSLLQDRDRYRAEAQRLRERLAAEWDFTVDPDDPTLHLCTADGKEVGTWHDCMADETCDNAELIRAMCAYRNRDRGSGPPGG
jgi:hypothetical protein